MLTGKTTKMNESMTTSSESEDDVVFVKATYNRTCCCLLIHLIVNNDKINRKTLPAPEKTLLVHKL